MKLKYLLIILIVLLLGAAGAYWYFFMSVPGFEGSDTSSGTNTPNGFVPFDRTPSNSSAVQPGQGSNIPVNGTGAPAENAQPLPRLRLLSDTPVGGYGASTTATTTVVRWVDRGRGNIYEARSTAAEIFTLSNTIFPRIYESSWNANLTAFVAQHMESEKAGIETISASIIKRALAETSTSTDLNFTEFILRGNTWNKNVITLALSPKKDRVFHIARENGKGVGYISSLEGKNPVKIFESPLTEVVSDWPEENIIVVSTKASSAHHGYVYFVNPKTGVWKKIVGSLPGLGIKVSRDGRYALISVTGSNQNIVTTVYDIKTGKGIDANISTLADKCTWGNFYKNVVYCAAPAQLPAGIYPDNWYTGEISFTDKIWQINASTGEINLISSIVDQSDRIIDAYKLDLDLKDNYLFFMNKNDLSLWSIDLVKSQ
jgi:hypothetical protein